MARFFLNDAIFVPLVAGYNEA